MLSRRSILRALGFGAPAAAVAAAVGVPVLAERSVVVSDAFVAAVRDNMSREVAKLSAINANMGNVTAGRVLNADHSLIIDLRAGTFTARS